MRKIRCILLLSVVLCWYAFTLLGAGEEVLFLSGSRVVGKAIKKLASSFYKEFPHLQLVVKEERLKKAIEDLQEGKIEGVLLTWRSYRKYKEEGIKFYPFLRRGFQRKGKFYYPFVYGIAARDPLDPDLKKLIDYLRSKEGKKAIQSLGKVYLPFTGEEN